VPRGNPTSRLNKDRQSHIQGKIADLMRDAEPTPFAVEGPCRAGIRSSLCLQGWPWTMADVTATDIVLAALNAVGARRPSWLEGQPEYTQPGAIPIERERCVRCRKPLPDGHWKFCGPICANADSSDRWWREHGERVNAERKARAHARRRERERNEA
jgi:hypothetical protein